MITIDAAGIPVDLQIEDDEVILDVVVLARVTRFQDGRGTSLLVVSAGEGTDVTVEVGMLSRALHMVQAQNGPQE